MHDVERIRQKIINLQARRAQESDQDLIEALDQATSTPTKFVGSTSCRCARTTSPRRYPRPSLWFQCDDQPWSCLDQPSF